MAARIAAYDWTATPLGAAGTWPAELRTAVSMMIDCGFPSALVWGRSLTTLYNDGFSAILGGKGDALGKPFSSIWGEIWSEIGPLVDRVFAGESIFQENYSLLIRRGDEDERAYFTFSYSPLRDARGQVCGLIDVVMETTQAVNDSMRLRESEARARRLVDGMAQANWETDAAGMVVNDSPSWRAYTGQSLEQWLGAGWLDVIHPEDQAFAEGQWLDAVAHPRQVDAEFRLRSAKGGWRWTNVRAVPLLDEQGAVIKWVGMNIDINARKDAELALRQSEERHAFLLQLSDALRPLSDADAIQRKAAELLSRQLKVDSAFYYDTNVEADIAIPTHGHVGSAQPPSPSSLSEFGDDVIAAFASGKSLIYSDTQRDRKLTAAQKAAFAGVGAHAVVAVPLLKAGRPVAALGVHHSQPRPWSEDELRLIDDVADRTWSAVERARAESSLQLSEARYRTLFEQVQEGFCIIERCSAPGDPIDFCWVEGNPAFMAIAKRADLIGLTMRATFPEEAERAIDIYERVLCTGEPAQFEYAMPSLELILELHVFRPGDEQSGQVAVLFQDITQRKRAELALAEAEQRQRALLEGIPQLVWRADGKGQWTWASPQWIGYTGLSEVDSLGEGWLETVHPDDRNAVRGAWLAAQDTGGFEVDYRVRGAAGHRYRWFHTRATPVLDYEGTIIEWLGTSTDVDEMRNLQERQHVLVAELQHRTRNLMGVINAVVEKTGRASKSMADFHSRLRDRLQALGRVQSMLSRLDDHDRVTFDELIHTELSAMNGGLERIDLEGPPGVRLRSSTVQTLAMALHELATNAVKYGALGQPHARLAIRWQLLPASDGAAPNLFIDWRESGVVMPDGEAEARSGQGRELIERALPYQLSAQTTYELGPDGVHCTIQLPVSARTHE
ncbi:MAG TPA: PAS domain-containing protein [Pseudoxanthomonas sp.]|nr:PAS domain-containing protein [Pseudoxanthomonas sp.]